MMTDPEITPWPMLVSTNFSTDFNQFIKPSVLQAQTTGKVNNMPIPTLINSASAANYTPCPEGSYQGAIVRVYYVGTQINTYNPTYKPQGKLVLVFELDEPTPEGNGNYRLSKTVSMALGDKSGMYKLFKPVLGSSYPQEGQSWNPESLLSLKVMVNVAHTVKNDKTYVDISSLGRIPRGMAPFTPEADEFCWSYDDPPREGIPQWVQDLAAKCCELNGGIPTLVNTAKASPAPANPATAQAKAAAAGIKLEPVDIDEYPF